MHRGKPTPAVSTTNADRLHGTTFISDALPLLKSLDNNSIDLVCIDPPFGKRQTFEGNITPPLSDDERRIERELMESWDVYDAATAYEVGLEYPDQTGTTAKFEDIWSFRVRVREDWMQLLATKCPGAYWLINATRHTHSDSIAAYIAFMVERMLEVQRVLKPTGSVYLHCDHEANAYLRQMMDAVFGKENFRNEIAWCYTGPSNTTRWFPRKHDTILFYANSRDATFNRDAVRIPYTRITGTGQSSLARGRRTDEEVKQLEERYSTRGKVPEDYWTDIAGGGHIPRHERTGYPTQKPQALAKRIIEASSNRGDIVLDCFAGCAYVPVAAQITGRRWIACDMSPRAWTVVRRQFHKQPELGILTEGEIAADEPDGTKIEQKLENGNRVIRVRGPHQLPKRTTVDEPALPVAGPLPEIQFRQSPLESSDTIWRAFINEWGPQCWYCGTAKVADRRELHLDHVEPNRRDGTNDDCWNRAIACTICNSNKSDRLAPEQTIQTAYKQGIIKTDALRQEVLEGFRNRHTWAKLRWERVKRSRDDVD